MKTQKKILKPQSLKKKLSVLRKQGREIVFTNGCFDILHFGHVSYLESIKKENNILVIGLNSDRSVKGIKGKARPIIHQEGRAKLLAGLGCVDYVVMFDEDTPQKLIEYLLPDVLIKGADWKGKEVAGADAVCKNGGKVRFVKYIDGFSTTNIINKILKNEKK